METMKVGRQRSVTRSAASTHSASALKSPPTPSGEPLVSDMAGKSDFKNRRQRTEKSRLSSETFSPQAARSAALSSVSSVSSGAESLPDRIRDHAIAVLMEVSRDSANSDAARVAAVRTLLEMTDQLGRHQKPVERPDARPLSSLSREELFSLLAAVRKNASV